MRERGLDPDFSPPGAGRSGRAPGPPTHLRGTDARPARAARGARSTTTIRAISISCRSPRRCPGGDVRVLVAIADVDAAVPKGSTIDRHAAHQHDVGLHARRGVSDAARAAVDRSHIAQRGEDRLADRHRVRRRRQTATIRAPGRLRRAGAESRQAGLQRRRRVADRPRTAAAGGGRRAGHGRAAAAAGRRRAGAQPPRATSCGALEFETIEVRPVFDGDTLRDLQPQDAEPRQGADREPDGRGQRRHGAVPRRARLSVASPRRQVARTLGSDSRAGRARSAITLPADADSRALDDAARAAPRRRTPRRFPISRGPSSSCSARASTSSIRRAPNRRAISASRCATTRTRPRRTGGIRTS